MSTGKAVQAPRQRKNGTTRQEGGQHEPWLTPRRTLIVAVVAIVAVAAVLIGVNVVGSGGSSKPTAISGSGPTEVLFTGIPQQGDVLGKANAPVHLVEYADPQCPYCGEFARSTLPTLVRQYVRDGKLKIEFRGLSFLGSDSERALRAAYAAGAQGKLWNMVDLLYRNQGAEKSGWVTDSLIGSAAAEIPGLDISRFNADRRSAATKAQMQTAAAQATSLMGSRLSTPTFEIGRTGQARQVLRLSSLDPGQFTAAIDQLLAQ